jgi:hypothetical protein
MLIKPALILVIELAVIVSVFVQNVLYFIKANIYKPQLNEEKEGEDQKTESKGAKKN